MSILTKTSMNTFDECPRRHWYRFVKGIEPVRDSEALRIGGAYHLGLDAFSRRRNTNDAMTAIRANYTSPPGWVAESADATHDWAVECETVVRLVCGWVWRWEGDGLETVASELSWEAPIVNPDTNASARLHSIAGKADRIVRREDGRLALFEAKTTGSDISPGSDYWRNLRMDRQIALYFYALRERYDLSDIIYDVCRKPCIRPKKPVKADVAGWPAYFDEQIEHTPTVPEVENAQMFGARLSADIGQRPEWYYQRQTLAIMDADIEDARRDTWAIHRAISDAESRDYWRRATRSCFILGRCPYFDICSNSTPIEPTPAGFKVLSDVHPELTEQHSDDTNAPSNETPTAPPIATTGPAQPGA